LNKVEHNLLQAVSDLVLAGSCIINICHEKYYTPHTRSKTLLEINFIRLHKTEIYCIFKTCNKMSFNS